MTVNEDNDVLAAPDIVIADDDIIHVSSSHCASSSLAQSGLFAPRPLPVADGRSSARETSAWNTEQSGSCAGTLTSRDLDLDPHARVSETRGDHHRRRPDLTEVLAEYWPA